MKKPTHSTEGRSLATPDAPVDVRPEDGWFSAYVDGRRVARLSSRALAEAVCRRMASPKGRIGRAVFFGVMPKKNQEQRDP